MICRSERTERPPTWVSIRRSDLQIVPNGTIHRIKKSTKKQQFSLMMQPNKINCVLTYQSMQK